MTRRIGFNAAASTPGSGVGSSATTNPVAVRLPSGTLTRTPGMSTTPSGTA
jgi:hypothetical protein